MTLKLIQTEYDKSLADYGKVIVKIRVVFLLPLQKEYNPD